MGDVVGMDGKPQKRGRARARGNETQAKKQISVTTPGALEPVLAALMVNGGCLVTACAAAGVSVDSVNGRRRRDPEFDAKLAAAVAAGQADETARVDRVLLTGALSGDPKMLDIYMKRKGLYAPTRTENKDVTEYNPRLLVAGK